MTSTSTMFILATGSDLATAPRMERPALLMRMSGVTSRSTIRLSNPARASRSERSVTSTLAFTPALLSSSARASNLPPRRATRVTPWPLRVNSRAMAAPIPEEAPVTTAVRSGAGEGGLMMDTVRQVLPWEG